MKYITPFALWLTGSIAAGFGVHDGDFLFIIIGLGCCYYAGNLMVVVYNEEND